MRRLIGFIILSFISACGVNEDNLSTVKKTVQGDSTKDFVSDWIIEAEALVKPELIARAQPHLQSGERVIHAMTRIMRYSGETVYRIVAFDPKSQNTRKFAVDSNGSLINYVSADATNRALGEKFHGPFTDELDTALAAAKSGSSTFELEMWYAAPPPPIRININSPTGEANETIRRSTYKSALATARAHLASDLVVGGGKILFESEYAPIIEARVTKAFIENNLRSRSDLVGVGISKRNIPRIPASLESSQDMNLELFHAQSFLGAPVRIGITEACTDCGIWIGNQNLVFSNYTTRNPLVGCTSHTDCAGMADANPQCAGGYCQGSHATFVAGMFGLRQSGVNAGASNARILHANGTGSHAELLSWRSNWDLHRF